MADQLFVRAKDIEKVDTVIMCADDQLFVRANDIEKVDIVIMRVADQLFVTPQLLKS